MTGQLRTVVLDAADRDAEAQLWSALLDIPGVHRSADWTTLQGRDVRLAVQLAPDPVRVAAGPNHCVRASGVANGGFVRLRRRWG